MSKIVDFSLCDPPGRASFRSQKLKQVEAVLVYLRQDGARTRDEHRRIENPFFADRARDFRQSNAGGHHKRSLYNALRDSYSDVYRPADREAHRDSCRESYRANSRDAQRETHRETHRPQPKSYEKDPGTRARNPLKRVLCSSVERELPRLGVLAGQGASGGLISALNGQKAAKRRFISGCAAAAPPRWTRVGVGEAGGPSTGGHEVVRRKSLRKAGEKSRDLPPAYVRLSRLLDPAKPLANQQLPPMLLFEALPGLEDKASPGERASRECLGVCEVLGRKSVEKGRFSR